MNLSTLTGDAKPYLEYGWVCAPNTAAQIPPANTITTLTIDTEVADTGNFGSIASNQITLAAGTYYFKAHSPCSVAVNYYGSGTLGLYNVTASKYVTIGCQDTVNGTGTFKVEGQFTISSTAVFELRVCAGGSYGWFVANFGGGGQSFLSTAGADQRTTIKLWKLA